MAAHGDAVCGGLEAVCAGEGGGDTIASANVGGHAEWRATEGNEGAFAAGGVADGEVGAERVEVGRITITDWGTLVITKGLAPAS